MLGEQTFAQLRTGLRVRTVYMDVKQPWSIASQLRSCEKVEVAVLDSPTLIVRTVSLDVKQH